MKELVHKNILGNNPRKKEISIEEVNDKAMHGVTKKWICKYFVRDVYQAGSKANLKAWVALKKREGILRNCHVLRNSDTNTGSSTIICKVLGDMYVIAGACAYKIVYFNEIRIHVKGRNEK